MSDYSLLDAMKVHKRIEGLDVHNDETIDSFSNDPEYIKMGEYANLCLESGHDTLLSLFPQQDDLITAGKFIAAMSTLSVISQMPMALMFKDYLMAAAVQATKIALGVAKKEKWFEDDLP